MNTLLLATIFFADTVVYPMQPEKIDPSTVAVTNEHSCGWWPYPYHERYRIMVDFDFDGHDDMLLSEPRASLEREEVRGKFIAGRMVFTRLLAI